MDQNVLSKQLGIGKITSIEQYPLGQINKTYKITAVRGMFSLRVYQKTNIDEISFEVALLTFLKGLPGSSKLPVPQLRKIKRNYITLIEGKYAVLYKYLPGKILKTFSQKQLQEVGKTIAQFHKKARPFHWDKKRHKHYDLPDEKIESYLQEIKQASLPNQDLLPELVDTLKKHMLPSDMPTGPIHVDIKPENVLFEKGALTGILDFDNSYLGPFVLDLAKSMVWFGLPKNKKNTWDSKKAIQIYKGYIEERPLSAEEYDLLYSAMHLAFASHIFVDYYKYAKGLLSQDYFTFMVTDFYEAYKSFKLNQEDFYALLG